MLGKIMEYYRLRKGLSKKELAKHVGVTPMAISNYESNSRRPTMDLLKKIADCLGVKISDFVVRDSSEIVFEHGEFRKLSRMSASKQRAVKLEVEDYFSRFFDVVNILGGPVILPKAPSVHALNLEDDDEKNAENLRRYLGFQTFGPVGDMVGALENNGIFVYEISQLLDDFSGINGFVNGTPYIAINSVMTMERIRSTIVHELAHFMFRWPDDMPDKEVEKRATSISGAFLFPYKDAIRELGLKRTRLSRDMVMVCQEYGISMFLLIKRSSLCNIISSSLEKLFYIEATKHGWKKNEPSRYKGCEKTVLFEQLVYRAISEENISIQKGVELLKKPYSEVEREYMVYEA